MEPGEVQAPERALKFAHILTPAGFRHQQQICVDAAGRITAIGAAPEGAALDGWIALPGMPNAHSHAFQRALAGYGEAAAGEDSFWSWREAMYRLAGRVTPEALQVIARRAYCEMLAAGFTSVAEFHYLHHGRDGARGPETGLAIAEAAREAGIRLVLLPVYYERGGFGRAAGAGQARFVHDGVEAFFALVERLPASGIAAHSLRAVPADRLADLVAGADALVGADCPLHMHVAEQPAEVDECLAATGRRPVELLAAHVELGPRWNLVHATHADAGERRAVAASGATVVICPLTEAYLGDGLFPVAEFVRAGGRVAVGSDANVRIDAIEELRWLEYGQRLLAGRRARLADGRGLGAALWSRVASGGAAALGQPAGRLEPGAWADVVALDPDAAVLQGAATPDAALDALVTAGDGRCLAGCWVGGRRVAPGGDGDAFRGVVRSLMAGRAA